DDGFRLGSTNDEAANQKIITCQNLTTGGNISSSPASGVKIVEFKQSHATCRGRLRIAITLHDRSVSSRLQSKIERRLATIRWIEVIAANCLRGCSCKSPVIVRRYHVLI